MKYYIIAGEKSGDMHAAKLVTELQKLDTNAVFRGWGGDAMQNAGVTLVRHYRETSFMGIGEVIKNIFTIRRFLQKCKDDIMQMQPDVVILVDYAGFNLKIAKFAKKKGFKTFYYISPKIWAWYQSRAHNIKKVVDKMFVIMHFEKEFYKKFNFEVDYVGNPIFDAVDAFTPNPNFLAQHHLGDKPIIALLPGSRKQEIVNILPLMLKMPQYFPEYTFVVAGVEEIPKSYYDGISEKIVFNQTYDLLKNASAAIVTSGTATLETALFEVPQVVCYQTGLLTYVLGKLLIKVPFISLVNLIAGKEIVKELIQYDFNEEQLKKELGKILGTHKNQIKADYQAMKEMIKTQGVSKETARLMYGYLTTVDSAIKM
jgi:lipid-A-disaccharide synthase